MLEAGPPLNPKKITKSTCGLTTFLTVAAGLAENSRARWVTNSWRPTEPGISKASPTPSAPGSDSAGSARELLEAGQIIGDESRYALRLSIFAPAPPTHGRRLAHAIRGSCALLRQSRVLYRSFRDQVKHLQRAGGVFLPPPPPRCTKTLIKSLRQTECSVRAFTVAILTKPLNGRAACHYCGQCGRGFLPLPTSVPAR